MRRQTERAVALPYLVLLLVDARQGITAEDRHFARLLRRSRTPVLLVAQMRGRCGARRPARGSRARLDEPVAVSAEHGEGMVELYDALVARLGPPPRSTRRTIPMRSGTTGRDDAPQRPLRLAIVGGPMSASRR